MAVFFFILVAYEGFSSYITMYYHMKKLSDKEKQVRKALADIYPQLRINARKVCGGGFDIWGEDLLAMSIEFFLEKETDYQLKVIADGKIEHYITRIMNFQLKLGTTKFYHKYRKFSERGREMYDNYNYGDAYITNSEPFPDEIGECAQCIQEEIEKLDPYLKMLAKERLIEGRKYKELTEKYNNISYHNMKVDSEELQIKLRNKCHKYL